MKQIIFGQLNKEFFEKHQKLLLFIANCWFLKWIIGTNRLPKDIKGKRINRILPASVHYKTGNLIEKKVSRKGFRPKKILVEEWKMCAFTRPRFAESLSHRLYYFWKLCHLFDIQIANKLNPAWNLGFDSASYFSGAGDGCVYYNTSKSWATTHDTADGTGFFLTNKEETFAASGLNSALLYIVRGFLPFDTSGLPDNATISAALVYVYVSAVGDGDNDGDDWLNVVQGLQADPTTLVVGDYDACGDAVTNPTEGATRIDLGNITASQYNSFTLNATGRGWISKTGYTKLGVREGHDCINSAYAGADGTVNRIAIRYSEYTGTGSDPYLSVTYTTTSIKKVSGVA